MSKKKTVAKTDEQVIQGLAARVKRLKGKLGKTEDAVQARALRKRVKRAQRRTRALKPPVAAAKT